MKVIFSVDVKGQGKKGEMKEVSEGYGRNYLLPRKLAVEATADNLNTMRMKEKAKAAAIAAEKAKATENAKALESLIVKIPAKAGSNGRLFGSITTKEIAEQLKAQHGIDLPKAKRVLADPIKAFGGYELKAKLGYEVTGTFKVMVVEN